MYKLYEKVSGLSISEPDQIKLKCTECGLCTKNCAFLQKYGTPKEIAVNYATDSESWHKKAYECSLCNLCTAVCPEKLNPASMLLSFRREAIFHKKPVSKKYSGILNYEKRGLSDKYTLFHIPKNCETVFFPGCSLPGTRPEQTFKAYNYIRAKEPGAGIVLSCCSKPSHDLGRQTDFNNAFSILKQRLLAQGVKTIIVACPNCYKVFSSYSEELQTVSIYEFLTEKGFHLPEPAFTDDYSIHDPCATRFDNSVQRSVRRLAETNGIKITEPANAYDQTLCCGEGGSVGCMAPEFSDGWTTKAVKQAERKPVISYCAGCVSFIGKKTEALHIMDFLFAPEKTASGKLKIASAPFTYLNRLSLKKRLKNISPDQEHYMKEENKTKPVGRFLLLFLIVATIAFLKTSGISADITPEKLQNVASELGYIAPLLYILLYSAAPSFFLPGLPISIAGGIIFGPFWGVIYTITGATIGAGIAFLSARYIAGDTIAKKTNSPRWQKLNNSVEENGWKIVIFTRLIPLFPFNLLNYFFGLTRIKFSHYLIASFFGMLPGTIAFIVFSSSIPELLKGNISTEFIVGIIAVILIILLPAFYKKFKKTSDQA